MRTDPTEGRPDEAAPSRRLFVKGAAAAGIGVWAAPVITSMTSVAGAQGSPACGPANCDIPAPCPDNPNPDCACAPHHGGGGTFCWHLAACYGEGTVENICETDADCVRQGYERCGDIAPGACHCGGPAPTACFAGCADGQVAGAPTVTVL